MVARRKSFFEKQWVNLTGVIALIVMLVGAGFACGSYQASLECEKEQIILIQEYNEKLNSEEVLCKTATIVGLKREVKELKEVTKYLKGERHEK